MASLSTINSRIGYYQGEIQENKIEIKELENDYNQLVAFKGKVQVSQQNFAEGNRNKLKALEAVKKFTNNNSHAKRYYIRTKTGLSQTGEKLLSKGYGFLLDKISDELRRIRNKISNLETKNGDYERKISNLRDDYRKEKERLEEEAKK